MVCSISRIPLFATVLMLAFAFASSSIAPQALAQGRPRGGGLGGLGRGHDYYNLGPIGAMGMPNNQGIEVLVVEPDGAAARAGLKTGDVITAAGGTSFTAGGDHVLAYGKAFDRAEEARNATLELELASGRKVDVMLRTTPKAGERAPGDKSAETFAAACEYLAKQQKGDGSWHCGLTSGIPVVTALSGLVLMVSGEAKYQGAINKAAAWVMANAGANRAGNLGKQWDQTNWGLAYGSWFLAAWNDKRPSGEARAALQKFANQLVANQAKGGEQGAYQKGGGWAHGPASNGPNRLNYVELEIMSNYALAALAFAKQAGCDVPDSAIRSAQSYIADCTTPAGGVAYSTRRGQFPGTAASGRTAGALFAMTASDGPASLRAKMGGYVRAHVDSIPLGHGSPTMHMLAGALGSHAAGGDCFQTFWSQWRIRIMLSRCADGKLRTWPTSESRTIGNTDISCGDIWTTANLALALGFRDGDVPLLGGGGHQRRRPPSRRPAADPEAETTSGPESGATDDAADQAEPAEVKYSKGTPEYHRFMQILSDLIPAGHRALKADSVTASLAMLSDADRDRVGRMAAALADRASGTDRSLLRDFRRLATGD